LKFRGWNWILNNLIGQIRGLIMKQLMFGSQLGLIEEIKDYEPTCKWCMILRVEIGEIKG